MEYQNEIIPIVAKIMENFTDTITEYKEMVRESKKFKSGG